jgi:hypothetical protein
MARNTRSGSTARPANRKGTQRTKVSKTGATRIKKPEPAVQQVEQQVVVKRAFREPPKVTGELPVPTATFYF